MSEVTPTPASPPPEPTPLQPEDMSAELGVSQKKARRFLSSFTISLAVTAAVIVVAGGGMLYVHGRSKELLTDGLQAFAGAGAYLLEGTFTQSKEGQPLATIDVSLQRQQKQLFINGEGDIKLDDGRDIRPRTEMIVDADRALYIKPTQPDAAYIDWLVGQSNPAEALAILQFEGMSRSLAKDTWLRLEKPDLQSPSLLPLLKQPLLHPSVDCFERLLGGVKEVSTAEIAKLTTAALLTEASEDNGREHFTLLVNDAQVHEMFNCVAPDVKASTPVTVECIVNKEKRRLEGMNLYFDADETRYRFAATIAYDEQAPRRPPSEAIYIKELPAVVKEKAAFIERHVRERLDSFPILRDIILELQTDEREMKQAEAPRQP